MKYLCLMLFWPSIVHGGPLSVYICVHEHVYSMKCPPVSKLGLPEAGARPPPGAWGTWCRIVNFIGISLASESSSVVWGQFSVQGHIFVPPSTCLFSSLRADDILQVSSWHSCGPRGCQLLVLSQCCYSNISLLLGGG